MRKWQQLICALSITAKLEVLTSQYVRFATEANWLLWDCLLCGLLQYLTKLPLFTTQCSFHRRQAVGSLRPAENGRGKGLHWQKIALPNVTLPLTICIWICAEKPHHTLPPNAFYSPTKTLNLDWLINFITWINKEISVVILVFIIAWLVPMWTL